MPLVYKKMHPCAKDFPPLELREAEHEAHQILHMVGHLNLQQITKARQTSSESWTFRLRSLYSLTAQVHIRGWQQFPKF